MTRRGLFTLLKTLVASAITSPVAAAFSRTVKYGRGVFNPHRFGEGAYSGTKARPYARSNGQQAKFNTQADAERAIRRAKRWLANQSRGPADVPPSHIFARAEMAAHQFPELVKTA